jgi:hypothetical protein
VNKERTDIFAVFCRKQENKLCKHRNCRELRKWRRWQSIPDRENILCKGESVLAYGIYTHS